MPDDRFHAPLPMSDDQFQLDRDHACYGKDGVRVLLSVPVPTGADGVRDLDFRVRVWGPFEASYTSGDNTEIVPSDSLRRHLLQVAASKPQDSPESICEAAVAQIEDANPCFTAVLVEVQERIWEPSPDPTPLTRMSLRFGSARSNTGAAVTVAGGVDELSLILTGGSGFTGFRRDRLTVQSDATDRPLCGTLWARWHWLAGYVPTLAESRAVAADLAGAFAGRSTNAIQELVTAASTDLLGCTPALVQVRARLAALPLVPLPLELVGDVSSDAVAHEVHDSPLGVTEVLVRRPPA